MTSTGESKIMRNSRLVFMVLIGLAMIEFSIGQSLTAAPSDTSSKTSHASSKNTTSAASAAAKPHKSSKLAKSGKAMNGLAAIYSDRLNGRKTASGQKFSQVQMTAAHRSLPLGTKVLVTNIRNNKSVEVRINDRGPRHAGRVIDLTTAAASKIGMKKTGNAFVKLEIVSGSSFGKSEG